MPASHCRPALHRVSRRGPRHFHPRAAFPVSVGALLTIAIALVLALGALVVTPRTAHAGQASSGQLLFYPCTDCHPVFINPATGVPTKPLPNAFKGHQIVLRGHDKLGVGNDACLACHDSPSRNPGKLRTVDGSFVDITGDVALVCYRCHEDKYKEWKAGTHGKHKPSCVAAGCHDPHTPQFIFGSSLMPFTGTGFQFKSLSGRVPFMALMTPPLDPAVLTPWWTSGLAVIGVVTVGVLGVVIFRTGRSKQ